MSLPIDSILINVDISGAVWQNSSWASEYDEVIFDEYVLPPRVADEPIEYWWRQDIPNWLGVDLARDDDMLTLSRKINARIDVPIKRDA